MLLTLGAGCLRGMVVGGKGASKKQARLKLVDLPAFTKQTLGLSGINLSTDLLAGADRATLEGFRERADRESCSCLLLVEPEAQALGSPDEGKASAAQQRLIRVAQAAQILGCSAAAAGIEASDDDAVLTRVAARLKAVMEVAEKGDLNILLAPTAGLTARPERVTELLKKVGGFRIGTYPDFQRASEQKDAGSYLQRLTPYATVVSASTVSFETPDGKPPLEGYAGPLIHKPYDLRLMVRAIASVGYEGPLSLEYRGTGDVVAGVIFARDAIRSAMGQGDEDDEDDLDLDLLDEDESPEVEDKDD